MVARHDSPQDLVFPVTLSIRGGGRYHHQLDGRNATNGKAGEGSFELSWIQIYSSNGDGMQGSEAAAVVFDFTGESAEYRAFE